jgi:SAM-dependent methyltransferase
MLEKCVDGVNSILTWMKRSQRIPTNGALVKVNFGSSLFVADGWINVDGAPHVFFARWPRPLVRWTYRLSGAHEWFGPEANYISVLKGNRFVHHDLRYGLPFNDDSVDYIYASHVLEHFYRDTAEAILRDAFRVLKKGGRIRVCVPNLEHAIKLYLEGSTEKSLEFFFLDSDAGLFYRHKYMYDFNLLRCKLRAVGFATVERLAYQEGKVPDLEKLDNRPDQTLYVEAVK